MWMRRLLLIISIILLISSINGCKTDETVDDNRTIVDSEEVKEEPREMKRPERGMQGQEKEEQYMTEEERIKEKGPDPNEEGISFDDVNINELEESTQDNFGFHQSSMSYDEMINAGLKVINLENTFFTIWIPERFEEIEDKRALVSVHGSYADAYIGTMGELNLARENNYAIIAVQWYLGMEQYLNSREIYELINISVQYAVENYDIDEHSLAYTGFSRGSANSFEVTFWDKYEETDYFVLTISHSGAIPPEQPTEFVSDLLDGEFGTDAFSDKHFFLYCGLQDEEWGTDMCHYMNYTEDLLEEYGAVIEEYIHDNEGGHMGYSESEEYHSSAIDLFLELSS